MMSGLQAVPSWDDYFGQPRGALLYIMSAILPLGCIVATPFISLVGDRHGRRMGIFVGAVIIIIGAVTQGASVHFTMFLASRFIISFGLVFANAYAPMLIGDLAHPKERQVITSLYQTSWYIGAILAAWVTFVLETVGVTDAPERNILNRCLMIFNWLTSVASAFLTAYMKRRTQFLISVGGMLGILASQTLCAGLFNEDHNTATGKAVIAMLFLFYFFYNLAFNALLYSYPVEILHYPIRAKGFSLLMLFGKASKFINTVVNPIGLQALAWKF
ncbi:lactose permease [Fusarium langsethiae]|uniref:Lactose permease n=1 Tax=Fusarium langsethiae TaxID=179993 RepID=A0A0M9ENU7_FUSLA|nr:lactose permease [Fusarium langsethiae]GKU08437.1 unnamed protein product [Fusarium langsethiae]GKU22562.1 unnamed protein product [Fusarium langsethiae]